MKKDTTLERESFGSPFFYSYCITDPDEFGSEPITLSNSINSACQNYHIDIICFRDKISNTKQKLQLAKTCLEVSRKNNISKVLCNGDMEIALKLGFDGVHLTSTQFDQIIKAKENNLFTMISCHNEEEVIKAKQMGADAITFSPIFFKENKGQPKGIEELKRIVSLYQTDHFQIFALGGIITQTHINQVKSTNTSGFASIRYFNN